MTPTTSTHTVVYYLDDDGQIESYNESVDANGNVYAYTGSPPPKGAKLLTTEDITRIFRDRFKREEKAWGERQKQAKQVRADLVAKRSETIATLVSGGISEEAANIIIPEVKPFTERAFPSGDVAANLSAYGLTDDQIQRVVGGWA